MYAACAYKMIRMKVDAGDFLKSILNAVDFTREFKCGRYIKIPGDLRPILGNWNVWSR